MRALPGNNHLPYGMISLILASFISSATTVNTSTFDPYASKSRCPVACDATTKRGSWSLYGDVSQLATCNQTVILNMNLYYGNDSKTTDIPIQACTVTETSALGRRQTFSHESPSNHSASVFDTKKETQDIKILRWASKGRKAGNSSSALAPVAEALAETASARENGTPTVLFAKSSNIIMGLYAGSRIDNSKLHDTMITFSQKAASQSKATAAEICASDSLNTEILGMYVDTSGDLRAVQAAVRDWHDAKCLGGEDDSETWKGVSVGLVVGTDIPVGPDVTGTSDGVVKRATCSYTQAVAGDGCWALADRCKVTQDELVSYNKAGLCNNIMVGQYVCCSAGDLPDFSPQPNNDGTCKTFTIANGDTCAEIASSNSLKQAQIEERNQRTWGWTGCANLIPGQVICISTGEPPLPGVNEDAVCGPTVPGTTRPENIDDLASLNPCPLNACCNIWGSCGIATQFCTEHPADTGAPGAAVPGSNGCVYNCGTEIKNNDEAPAEFRKITYFEAWNDERPCLHMKASQIDTSLFTHVHFAFADITDSYDIDVSMLQDQFDDFKALTNVKRILTFGGWSFSTDYDTAPIFREGVTAEDRQLFANNIIAFIKDNDLDGVDFDWEYPGAPDIPGIPAGSPNDGKNYLAFLKIVRDALPSDKTVSIAAPASYWYLKGFPIDEIADVVDYIVYLTYDLHGQWDYGNDWASENCDNGDCLRSHVNQTETEFAFSMITKAGVAANKVIVGMAQYGRSFEMTTAGCYGPDCKYTGPGSGATAGRCTGTSGYLSNFEIREIISTDSSAQQYSDDEGGDILVYNDVQWVSWMSKAHYDERVEWVRGLNFGGVSDWAIDLDADYGSDDEPGQGDGGSGPVYISPDIWKQSDPVVQCEPPCTFIFPPWVLPTPTTISMDPVTVTYREVWYTTVTKSGAVITTSVGQVTSTVITTRTKGDDRDPITWTYSPSPYPTPPDPSTTTTPLPPPSGSPSTVRPTSGPPKPTCTPATQTCGNRCGKFCGGGGGGGDLDLPCIGVPLLCPGGVSNCVGFCSDGGGAGGSDDPDESCRKKTTASYCSQRCSVIKYPQTTTTTCSSRDLTCTRTITACTATDSTTTSTKTLECATTPEPANTGAGGDTVPIIGDGGWGGFIVNPGDFSSMSSAPTQSTGTSTQSTGTPTESTGTPTPTGGSDPDPTLVAAIPDCLWVYVLQYTTTETENKGVSDLTIIYQNSQFCGGAIWCAEYTENNADTPLLCESANAKCSKSPEWSGYVIRLSQISRGLLKDWLGVSINGHPLSEDSDGPQDIDAYFEIPMLEMTKGGCGVNTELSADYDECWELRYGGWFGGDECSNYPLFTSMAENGLAKELKKEDAVSKHEIF
ncbi:hypothetical protein CIB48_g2775 [Xylaria polymorpha]|nr:hypothetical protein CIB48_g2775 [Xylaria polymorpha]